MCWRFRLVRAGFNMNEPVVLSFSRITPRYIYLKWRVAPNFTFTLQWRMSQTSFLEYWLENLPIDLYGNIQPDEHMLRWVLWQHPPEGLTVYEAGQEIITHPDNSSVQRYTTVCLWYYYSRSYIQLPCGRLDFPSFCQSSGEPDGCYGN